MARTTPLALIVSAKPQILVGMMAMLTRAGYSCIGYRAAGDVPVHFEGLPVAVALLDVSCANVELSNRLVRAGTPVVLTSLFARSSSPALDARESWVSAQLAALEQQPRSSC